MDNSHFFEKTAEQIWKILVSDSKYECLTRFLWIGFCIQPQGSPPQAFKVFTVQFSSGRWRSFQVRHLYCGKPNYCPFVCIQTSGGFPPKCLLLKQVGGTKGVPGSHLKVSFFEEIFQITLSQKQIRNCLQDYMFLDFSFSPRGACPRSFKLQNRGDIYVIKPKQNG